MAWIFVDKESESGGEMRSQMRRNMRSGGNYRRYSGYPMMRNERSDEHYYTKGYREGWEDAEEEHYRR